MNNRVRSTIVAAASAALVFTILPPSAHATSAVTESPVGAFSAYQEYEEAKRQLDEMVRVVSKESIAKEKAAIEAANASVTNAKNVLNKATRAYKAKGTLANFGKLVRSQASHQQAIFLSAAAKSVANMESRIAIAAVHDLEEVALRPYSGRRFLEAVDAWTIVPPCAAYYDTSVTEVTLESTLALDEFTRGIPTQYQAVFAIYEDGLNSVFTVETKAKIDYEAAVRAHKARPTSMTRFNMEQAKISLDEAAWERKTSSKSLKLAFSSESKALYSGHVQWLKDAMAENLRQTRGIEAAYNECVLAYPED